MYVVKGRLTAEVAAVLMRAVEAASDALFAESAKDDGERTEPQQLRADAVGLLAERALAAGFSGDEAAGFGRDEAASFARDEAPVSGSRAERYQVMLYVEPETLAEHVEPGMSELEDGTRVSAETARRLACDASRVKVSSDGRDSAAGSADHSPHGSVLDVGRRTRTVPSALRRALEARDRGCRFPGCGLRFTDAHHIVHWADGGETTLANMVLLCRRHHRRVHEDGFRVFSDKNAQVVFYTPKGRAFTEVPQMPKLPKVPELPNVPEFPSDPFQRLVRRNRERGIEPDWLTGMPQWKRDHDIPWEIEGPALEAVLSAGDRDEGRPDEVEPQDDQVVETAA